MNTSRFSIRNLIVGNVITVLVISFFLFIFSSTLDLFELKTVDGRFQFRNYVNKNPVFSSDIVHINIDDSSKQLSGLDLWPKQHYADLIINLSRGNPEVIAFDIMFVRSLDSLGNGALKNSVIQAGNIISPFIFQFKKLNSTTKIQESKLIDSAIGIDGFPILEKEKLSSATGYRYSPVLDLVNQSAGLGFVNMSPDIDGVIRRIPIAAEYKGRMVPSFFLQSLCSYLDYDLSNIEVVSREKLLFHDFPGKDKEMVELSIPLDGQGNLLVNYAGPLKNTNYPQSFGAWEVLQLNSPPTELTKKLVIISDISSTSNDHSPVPVDNVFPRSYILSNAMNTLLSGEHLREIPQVYLPIIISGFTLFLLFICVKLDIFLFAITSLVLLGFYVGSAFVLFIVCGLIIPIFPVIIPVTGVYFFSSLYKFANTERVRGILEGSLQSYLPPSLMEKVHANPDELLKVGGERKRISVLFADVVNFTQFCDKADPEEVQNVLERYFKEMAVIIFSEHGTIDKYIGDAILAFFENPDDEVTSASTAIRCAVAMQKKAEELDTIYKSQNRFPFSIRIGVTTGYAKVGNIGPVEKYDYTIIGSVVNLANRLQTLGSSGDIIFEKETLFFVKDDYTIENMGKQALKGFTESIEIHKIVK